MQTYHCSSTIHAYSKKVLLFHVFLNPLGTENLFICWLPMQLNDWLKFFLYFHFLWFKYCINTRRISFFTLPVDLSILMQYHGKACIFSYVAGLQHLERQFSLVTKLCWLKHRTSSFYFLPCQWKLYSKPNNCNEINGFWMTTFNFN
jgi:hypothetical protein